MEDDPNTVYEKKSLSKAKSHTGGPLSKLKNEVTKRKSCNTTDLALSRLKKSKLVDGECTSNTAHASPVRHGLASARMYIDSLTEPNYSYGVDSASIMSMNFSHYELMRNLSCTNCNSDAAFSCTASSAYMTASDVISKNEHLERYFRSVEMWNKNGSDPNASSLHMPDH